jgi:hypothetical protein
MAIIDTLKLARALRDKGGFTTEAAEATAEALNEAIGDAAASKRDLAELELRLVKWVIGVGIAATLAVGGMIWTATQVLLRALPHG